MRLFVMFSVVGLLSAGPVSAQDRAVEARNGMIVCVSPAAAAVGVDVLKKGGNAVDSSVAVALAMAVTHPQAGNIGGGGFMLVYPGSGKEPVVFEYREKAPKSVNRDTFINEKSAHTH